MIYWRKLSHKGPLFAPPYRRLPANVTLTYNGRSMRLKPASEEIATFYAKLIDTKYVKKAIFRRNFFEDWKRYMTSQERATIKDLNKCNFKLMAKYLQKKSKLTLKEKEAKKRAEKVHGSCLIDGRKECIGNFRVEPPGIFMGRGHHPMMGRIKKRVLPKDVTLNIGQRLAPKAPLGHKWKAVIRNNSVSWLASWKENIMGSTKYMMLKTSSGIKTKKDQDKYEKARELAKNLVRIRKRYESDLNDEDAALRKKATAVYLIDRFSFRVGNDKDKTETADTVGCCSFRVEHVKLEPKNVVRFDFPGKDCIRYKNSATVQKKVYDNLKLFTRNKQRRDDLFTGLSSAALNAYLNTLMVGLTAKVFRTCNASVVFEQQLRASSRPQMSLLQNLLAYSRANGEVAKICNHQRAVPSNFATQVVTLKKKIKKKKVQINGLLILKIRMQKERYQKRLKHLEDQLLRLEHKLKDKEENKDLALGTSRLNYLDPRITVAWCNRRNVGIDKVYSKTQRERFSWAIERNASHFVFKR